MSVKKQFLKVLLLTNPCKREWENTYPTAEVQKSFITCVTTGLDCSKSEPLFNSINDKLMKDDIHWQSVMVLVLIIEHGNLQFC